jgi:hypothetical protein
LRKLSDEQLEVLGDYFLRGATGLTDPQQLETARLQIEAGDVVFDDKSQDVTPISASTETGGHPNQSGRAGAMAAPNAHRTAPLSVSSSRVQPKLVDETYDIPDFEN